MAHTAVFELVKNAYDAHATQVSIIFQNVTSDARTNESTITIVDNGDGMSHEDIVNKWLFVGYSAKSADKNRDFRDKAASKNRVMTGSKGIGRFSADQLGGKLVLHTKTSADPTIHRLTMDWGEFDVDKGKEFHEVKVAYDRVNTFPHTSIKKLKHGTILEISPLNDVWDKPKLLNLKRYLQRLVNPVQIPDKEEFTIQIFAEEFLESDEQLSKKCKHERINGQVRNIVFEKMKIKTTQITCDITKSKITTQIVDKGRFVLETEERNSLKNLTDVRIRIFYLNRAAKVSFTRSMGIRPVRFGSIFLYKNGFRIHPYGDEGDDWLGLERRKGQGYSRYLAARELIGRVEINSNQLGFDEVSSRHGGVVETKEYRQLLEFMKIRVIRWLERYVIEGLDWDRPKDDMKITSDEINEQSLKVLAKFTKQIKDSNKRIKLNPHISDILEDKRNRDLPEVMKNLRTLSSFVKSNTDKTRIKNDLRRVEGMVKRHKAGEVAATKALKAKEKEIMFLKDSQPADAKQAGDYGHWIRICAGNIDNKLKEMFSVINDGGSTEALMDMIESISRENQKIRTVASIISKANFNMRNDEKIGDIVAYIVQYVNNVASKRETRIHFACYDDRVEFNTKFMPLEISMMLDNFISNSRKAGADKITLKFTTANQMLRMMVSDSGKGISDDSRERVFQRGFTTTKGFGIGLSHIRSIARAMSGDVKFLGNDLPDLESGACFEVVFNART